MALRSGDYIPVYHRHSTRPIPAVMISAPPSGGGGTLRFEIRAG